MVTQKEHNKTIEKFEKLLKEEREDRIRSEDGLKNLMKGYVDEQIKDLKEIYDEKIDTAIDTLREQLRGELRKELANYALFVHTRFECLKTFLGIYKNFWERLRDGVVEKGKTVVQGAAAAKCTAIVTAATSPTMFAAPAIGGAAGWGCSHLAGEGYDWAIGLFGIDGKNDGTGC
uniref:Uncharacterized protein n=2 Tax=Meloidogyne TaxID=189290 RepID=A0A6V7W7G9_MELEN|nr:unnamed protein product [Meloidogyne enterolobii]